MQNGRTTEQFRALETEFKSILESLKNAKDLDEKQCLLKSLHRLIRRMDGLIARSQRKVLEHLDQLRRGRER
jgi:hypothetical protein